MNKVLAISAVAVLVAGPAIAADAIAPMPTPTVPVVDDSSAWDGFYAGLNAGYGWGEGDIDGALVGEEDIDGWLGGAQVGYNFSSGIAVFGVEADLQLADIVYEEDLGGGDSGDIGVGAFGTVRGRIGADLGGFMPYVTGGLAFSEVGYDVEIAGTNVTDSEWTWGWAAGLGLEAMVFDNVSLKAEYLYTDFGDADLTISGADLDVDGYAHTARIGFNYHF